MSVTTKAILLSIVALSTLIGIAKAECLYMSQRYPSSPTDPVIGDSLICYCEGNKWVRCSEKPNELGMHLLPKTAITARSKFKAKDFVFNLKGAMPSSSGLGGTIRPLGVAELPSLAKQGVSYSLFNIDACGINLPHVHPRATELLYVIKGQKLRTAFVEENGGRTLVNDISEGMATFFPEGLIHYQQNLDCEPAEYISALNSEDPGVVTISTQTFTLPDEALQATFNLNAKQLKILRAGIPAGPAKGRVECLKRCNQWGQDCGHVNCNDKCDDEDDWSHDDDDSIVCNKCCPKPKGGSYGGK